ncbi:hypothetical protein HER39_10985 [Arthrobacter deserti]|uniref:Uncharacterized protein n=1 Tax=Arthrobacter deserti TaxID=1742687 RepID=A0ABX1JQX6_9MICC|nr:hypothetical protein [Arthrobacter deserti]
MARTTQRQHAGEGRLAGNLITFAIVMAIFLASIVAFALEPEIGAIPAFALGLILFTLAFFIPKQLIGRSDSHEVK